MEAMVEADLDASPCRRSAAVSRDRSASTPEPGRLLDEHVRTGLQRALGAAPRAHRELTATMTTSGSSVEQLVELAHARAP